MAATVTQRTTIDDSKVQELINNPAMRRKFPFLATAYKKMKAGVSGCGGCGRKTSNKTSHLATARASIAAMPVQQKAQLKAAMGTRQVSVKYNNGRGKNILMRF